MIRTSNRDTSARSHSRLWTVSRRAAQSQRGFGEAAGTPAAPGACGDHKNHARLRHGLRGRRQRAAEIARRQARHCSDVRACRPPAAALHRNASAQRPLDPVSGCARLPAGARRHCAGRTGGAPRQRAVRPFAGGGARKPNAGPRCRATPAATSATTRIGERWRLPAEAAVRWSSSFTFPAFVSSRVANETTNTARRRLVLCLRPPKMCSLR